MMLCGFLISFVDDDGLETLKELNTVGFLLTSAFIISLFVLVLEVIDWLQKLSPQQENESASGQTSFGYGEVNGPLKWNKQFPSCNGKNQSPINIETFHTIVMEGCDNLKMKNFDVTPTSMVISNTGNSVRLCGVWPKDTEPTVTGGAVGKKTYVFKSAMFRWGQHDKEGSEHTINFERYPMELQMEFTDSCRSYGDVVMISYIFKISKKNNACLDNIMNGLCEITYPGLSSWISPFPLSVLRPFSSNYFSYHGSLTYPPCTENVLWIINPCLVSISCNQVNQFRSIRNEEGKILSNCRPVQCTNDRPVYFYPPSDFTDLGHSCCD